MIKAIAFDMGGVILDLDMEKCKEAFRTKAGMTSIDEYIDTFHQKGFWGDLEAGRIDAEEFFRITLELSAPGTTRETIYECFKEFIHGVPADKVEFLKEISRQYPIYLLSNTNPLAMEVCRDLFVGIGFYPEEIFTKMFLSFQMKMLKPSPEIYRAAIEGIGLPADEILFIDDSYTNVEAAAGEGMKAVYYEPGSNLRALTLSALRNKAF